MDACLFTVINAPTFQRVIPASFIQIVVLGGISIIEFIVCDYLFYSERNKKDYRIVDENKI